MWILVRDVPTVVLIGACVRECTAAWALYVAFVDDDSTSTSSRIACDSVVKSSRQQLKR